MTVTPGTDSGQPAASTAFRAMSKVCLAHLADAAPDHVVDQGRVEARSARASAWSTCPDMSTG